MDNDLKNFILSFKKENDKDKEKNIALFEKFFAGFFSKFPKNDYEQACKMTFDDIMLSLFLSHKPELSEDILEIYEKYADYFKSKRNRSLLKIILLYFNDLELQELIKQRKELTASIFYMLSDKVYKYVDKNKLPIMSFVKLYNLFNKNEQICLDFSILSDISKESIGKAFALYSYIEMFGGKYVVQKPKKKKRVQRDVILFLNSIDGGVHEMVGGEVAAFLNVIYAKYEDALKSIEFDKKAAIRHNQKIDELIGALDIQGEIKNIDYIMNLCPNDEIKSRVLDFILEHNINSYESLIIHYESLKDNSDDSFKTLFNKYGYDYGVLLNSDKIFLKNLGYDKVEEILNWFKSLELVLDLNSISRMSYEKIRIVKDLLGKGFLTKKFLKAHSELWTSSNNSLQVLVDNITLFNNNGINMINYANSLEVLFSEKIKDNLDILRTYGLVVTKTTNEIMFLNDNDLEEKIEVVIEMGLLDNLSSLDILNKSFEELYKMKLFKYLGLTKDISFYRHDEYYVSFATFIIDEKNKAELAKENAYRVSLPTSMLEYQISSQVLIIEGIYVSINRFLKNLGKLDRITDETIFYAIIYRAYYTMEEIETLKNALIPDVRDVNSTFRCI